MENTSSNDLQVVDKPVLNEVEGFKPEQTLTAEPADVMIEANERDGISPKKSLFKRPWFIFLSTIFLLLAVIFIWLGIAARATYVHVVSTSNHASDMLAAFELRDLTAAKIKLESTKTSLASAQKSWGNTAPLRFVPFLGLYLKDIDHVFVASSKGIEIGDMVIKAIEPYADIMGFTGTTGGDLQLATAEDRIIFVASTVEKLAPQMDEISLKLKEVSDEF
jgi:hypothetical protein